MNRRRDTVRHLIIASGAMALVLGGMWVANQGGLRPRAVVQYVAGVYRWFAALPWLLAIWLPAAGFGGWICRWLAPQVRRHLLLRLTCGLGALLLIDWLLGALGVVNGYVAWFVVGIGTGLLVIEHQLGKGASRWHPEQWPSPPWTLLIALPVAGVMMVACACPPGTLWAVEGFGHDVLNQHLQLPREWLTLGAMRPLPHNVHSFAPNLGETAFLRIALMHRSMLAGVYTAQMFSATCVLLTAAAVNALGQAIGGRAGSVLGATAFIATPWVVITGSSATPDALALLFGAVALVLLFDRANRTPRSALLIGMLCGLAAMARFSTGAMIGLPIVALLVMRLNVPADGEGPRARHRTLWRQLGAMLLGALLVMTPWLVRNAVVTGGNPIFPAAARTLGSNAWTEAQIQRWQQQQMPDAPAPERLKRLTLQWLISPGYGALGGWRFDLQRRPLGRFHRTGALPVLWLAALVGAAVAFGRPVSRRTSIAMLVVIAVQLVSAFALTDLTGRTMLPTVVPACALIGLASGRLERTAGWGRMWALAATALVLAGLLTSVTSEIFFTETGLITDGRRYMRQQPWQIVDSLGTLDDRVRDAGVTWVAGDHVLNQLPAGSRVCIVGQEEALLYIRVPMAYHTRYDRGPVGILIQRYYPNHLGALTPRLKRHGFTHVWVRWPGLDDFCAGRWPSRYTPTIDIAAIGRRYWRPVLHFPGQATLYALP